MAVNSLDLDSTTCHNRASLHGLGVCSTKQNSYNGVSQERGSADCNSSSNDEDSRKRKMANAYSHHNSKTSVDHTLCVLKLGDQICVLKTKNLHKDWTPGAWLCSRQCCKNSNTMLGTVSSPELLSHQELELLRLKQVEVFAQGVTLLHRATIGQSQVPQLVHMLEEEPLNLYTMKCRMLEISLCTC